MKNFKVFTENFEFFPKEPLKDIPLSGPNFDLDSATEEIKQIMQTRTKENEESINSHDENPYYAIEQYCMKNQLGFQDGELSGISEQALPTIKFFKNKFNLIRPHKHDSEIVPMDSKTNKTPSYPSGHACQSMLVGLHAASKYPDHKEKIIEAAKEGGYGRVLAGFHYMQDYHAGNKLAEEMFKRMNK